MTAATVFVGLALSLQNAAPQSPALTPRLKPAPQPSQVLAKVNGTEIKASDIQDLLWDLHGTAVLNDVVSYSVIRQEAEKLKLVVTDAEVDIKIDQEIARMGQNLQPGLTPGQILAQNGYTWSRLYINTRSLLLLLKIAFAEFQPSQYVRISTISLKPKTTTDADIAATTKLLQEAYNRLQKGEPWEKVLPEYVTDAEGVRTVGYLGWRNLELFDEAARKDIASLKKGEVSKPIRTQNGIQIFRIESQGGDAKPEDIAQMKEELAEELQTKVYVRLRRAYKVERFYPQ
jgi:foldase protein PrsA